MHFVGIDPGKSGGIARISGENVFVAAMPKTEDGICQLLAVALGSSFDGKTMLEKVGGFQQVAGPKCPVCHQQALRQPGHSMFSFGRVTGVVIGALHTLGIAFDEVEPQRWQAIYRLPLKGKKQDERKRIMKEHAQRLYPSVKVTLAVADALLLARYNMLKHQPMLAAVPLGQIPDRDLFEL